MSHLTPAFASSFSTPHSTAPPISGVNYSRDVGSTGVAGAVFFPTQISYPPTTHHSPLSLSTNIPPDQSLSATSDLLMTDAAVEGQYPKPPGLDKWILIEMLYQTAVIIVGFPINVWAAVRHVRLFRQRGFAAQRQDGRLARMSINLIIGNVLIHLHCAMKTVWLYTYYWKGGDVLCRLYQWNAAFCFQLSSNMVAVISIDMFYCIRSPLMAAVKGRQFVRRLVVGAWICAAIFSSPQLLLKGTISPPSFGGAEQCYLIYFEPKYEPFHLAYAVYHSIVVFYVPLMIIISCYACIGNTIKDRLQERKTMVTRTSTVRSQQSSQPCSSSELSMDPSSFKHQHHPYKNNPPNNNINSGRSALVPTTAIQPDEYSVLGPLLSSQNTTCSILNQQPYHQRRDSSAPFRGKNGGFERTLSQQSTNGTGAHTPQTPPARAVARGDSTEAWMMDGEAGFRSRRATFAREPPRTVSKKGSRQSSLNTSLRSSLSSSIGLLARFGSGKSSTGHGDGRPTLRRQDSKGVIMKKRLLKISLAIILTYIVTWLPYQVMSVCKQICSASRVTGSVCAITLARFEWLEAFMLLSTCINPFLYQFKMKHKRSHRNKNGGLLLVGGAAAVLVSSGIAPHIRGRLSSFNTNANTNHNNTASCSSPSGPIIATTYSTSLTTATARPQTLTKDSSMVIDPI